MWRAGKESAEVAVEGHVRWLWDFERGPKGHESSKPLRFGLDAKNEKGESKPISFLERMLKDAKVPDKHEGEEIKFARIGISIFSEAQIS